MRNKLIRTITVLTLLTGLFFGTVDYAEAAKKTLNGKSINEIPNIVKAMTGQSTLQIGKKSLMFLERVPVFNKGHTDARYSDNSYMQARIFSINEDGSLAKSFVLNTIDDTGQMFIGSDWDIKATRPVLASQASTSGFLAMYQGANGRNDSSVSEKLPVQTLKRSGSSTDSSFTTQTVTELSKNGWTNLYGSGALTLPKYDGEIFASAHSIGKSSMKSGSNVILTLSFMKYNHDRKPEHDTEKDFTLYTVDSKGLNNASITTGDFDDDGIKNDIAMLVCTESQIKVLVFSVTYNATKSDPVGLVKRYQKTIYNTPSGIAKFDSTAVGCASGNVFAGDFNGDGAQDFCVTFKTNDSGKWSYTFQNFIHAVFVWNGDTKTFDFRRYVSNTPFMTGLKGVAGDLDGDGKDEIILLAISSTGKSNEYVAPFLFAQSYDPSKDDKLVNYSDEIGPVYGWFALFIAYPFGREEPQWGETADRTFGNPQTIKYFPDEAFSIAAGAFSGKFGINKTIDDIAISFTDTSKKVYIVPSHASIYNGVASYYAGYIKAIKIYDSSEIDSSMSSKYNSAGKFYGGLLAGDLLGEGIELTNPQQLVDTSDPSYAVILPAFPYHVDNITTDGKALTNYPVNFSFSGFNGVDGINSEMAITYEKSTKVESSNKLTFSSTTTQDTFFTNNDSKVLKVANDYLQFKRMSSHMLADFGGDTKAGKIGGIAAKVYDFFNNHMENVSTKMNESSTTTLIKDKFKAEERDAVLMFDAKTYIWRYKVLGNYLPSWLNTDGGVLDTIPSINDNSVDIPAGADREYFITFSMQDDIVTSNKTNTYEARHEEGNLFSYPANLKDVEGYNSEGNLMTTGAREFYVPGTNGGVTLEFENAQSVGDHYKQEETPSEASKKLSFFKNALNDVKNLFTGGNSKVDSTPDQKEHSQNFTKTFATDESIGIEYNRRTTLPNSSVGYTAGFMPYLSKGGVMRVASYVNLDTDPSQNYHLWASPESLYNRSADPALILPEKFVVNGGGFRAQMNHVRAMHMRGVRFYSKEYGGYERKILIPGLTYIIEVPVYNASFKKAENVMVRLSYSNVCDPEVKQASTRTVIKDEIITLNGWDNVVNSTSDGTGNKKVIKFEWKVPESITDGDYYFYVDIDPKGNLVEVHESRMKSPTEVADCGGNNEGFFPFSVLHLSEENANKILAASSVAPTGVLYASSMNGAVRASSGVEQVPHLNTKVRLNGSENIDDVYEMLRQAKITSPDDEIVIDCEVENVTGVIFPEAILYGLNVKPGEEYYTNTPEGEIEFNYEAFDHAFVRHEMMLFPNNTTKFTIAVKPADIDFDNAIFALVIPNMPITDSGNGEDDYPDPVIDDDPDTSDDPDTPANNPGSSGGGCDVGFGSMIMLSLAGMYVFMKK